MRPASGQGAMTSQQVHPLRIQKNTPSSPPQAMDNSSQRALSELAPTEKRRNSSSFNQNSQTPSKQKMVLNLDSSPFQSSPFNGSESNSPRLFWQGREGVTPNRLSVENFGQHELSGSPTRRTSIERLKRASRVKNSTMFAREQKLVYDPTTIPRVERPLAKQIQGNAYGGSGLQPRSRSKEQQRSKEVVSPYTPTKSQQKAGDKGNAQTESPTKDQGSPAKSSLTVPRAVYDQDNQDFHEDIDDDVLHEGRLSRQQAKSVTFDAAPPQINEYEMVTPDLSSISTNSREGSYDSIEDEDDDDFSRSGSLEHEDSFDASLEDTDKTPVVGPDDWRHASPYSNDESSAQLSGAFNSPSSMSESETISPDVTLSLNGDHRPLPPLPGSSETRSSGLFSSAEHASTSPRGSFAASLSKSDIQGLSSGRMPLEERLRLMMIQDDDAPKTAAEMQRERRMRRGSARDHSSTTPDADDGEIKIHEDEDTLADLGEYQLPERISRESIMRKVNGHYNSDVDPDYNFSSPGSSPGRPALDVAHLDPDVPIPSTEVAEDEVAEDASIISDNSVIVRPEAEEGSEVDMHSLQDAPEVRPESRIEDYGIDDAADHHSFNEHHGLHDHHSLHDHSLHDHHSLHEDENQDEESHYSDPNSPAEQTPEPESLAVPEENDARETTPKPDHAEHDLPSNEEHASQPRLSGKLSGFMSTDDFERSMDSYRSPSPPEQPKEEEKEVKAPSEPAEEIHRPSTPEESPKRSLQYDSLPKPDYDGAGWGSDDEEQDEPGTPESVVHHRMSSDEEIQEEPPAGIPEEVPEKTPSPGVTIPERTATIKAALGSKLKTRPSATPSDIMAMKEARRQVSTDYPVPPIPKRHQKQPADHGSDDEEHSDHAQRPTPRKPSGLKLDIGDDLGLSLTEDFERVIQTQKVAFNQSHSRSMQFPSGSGQVFNPQAGKPQSETPESLELHANITPRKQRGYLMRQNTKVVVASSDVDKAPPAVPEPQSAGNPLPKNRPQSWTVEPWNGTPRKRSHTDSTAVRRKTPNGVAPPLPGQKSNVDGLGSVTEDDINADASDGQNGERGRLFVKVIGVKDLDLPLPRNERTWFALTLDNGVHCVTTAWLELGRNAPIGQEFELVVPNELEFQLTLNAKLQRPPPKRVEASPAKPAKANKPSTFSRVFTSPKKRREMEMRQKEEEQRIATQKHNEMLAKRSQQPTAWELISPLAGDDGSFGRSYICLRDHEQRCFGRPYVVDVTCFNEWATDEVEGMSSVKSKTGATQARRRAPYKIGKLELQLLFVPKPKNAKDEDMPKSMNSCIREMKEAEQALARSFEGFLSQQGGDCPFWRRRLFKLNGSRLTAYHESTGQPRATINLANASKLIDDRRALTQRETTGKNGSRRKSGFAEEEEGYMFVEEGFRIRFANGEVIDFYADTGRDKEEWMKVLDQCIGTNSQGRDSTTSWCELILKKEESARRREVRKPSARYHHSRTKSAVV